MDIVTPSESGANVATPGEDAYARLFLNMEQNNRKLELGVSSNNEVDVTFTQRF